MSAIESVGTFDNFAQVHAGDFPEESMLNEYSKVLEAHRQQLARQRGVTLAELRLGELATYSEEAPDINDTI